MHKYIRTPAVQHLYEDILPWKKRLNRLCVEKDKLSVPHSMSVSDPISGKLNVRTKYSEG